MRYVWCASTLFVIRVLTSHPPLVCSDRPGFDADGQPIALNKKKKAALVADKVDFRFVCCFEWHKVTHLSPF